VKRVLAGLVLVSSIFRNVPQAAAYEEAATATTAPAPAFDPFLAPVQTEAGEQETERLHTRRTYLKVHQAAGITSLALLIAQVSLGQYLLNEKRSGNISDSYESLREKHKYLSFATFGVYSVAAGAALLAPKIDREGAYDTLTVHKSLAIIHGTGMLLTPLLGYYQVGQVDKIKTQQDADRVRTLNTVHQVIGYTTAAALAGAMLVIVIQ
jgi:hypothetical protein